MSGRLARLSRLSFNQYTEHFSSCSLGVLVDLEGGPDGPEPADDDGGGDELDDTDDDGGLSVGLALGEESSDDGAPATGEDTDEKDDETVLLLKLNGAHLFVHFTHGCDFVLNYIIKLSTLFYTESSTIDPLVSLIINKS